MLMSGKTITIQLYGAIIALIAGWWFYAFAPSKHQPSSQSQISFPAPELAPNQSLMKYLSPLHRDTLKIALGGDFSLMTNLISEWDVDAQILKSHGVADVKRLTRQEFLRSQILLRQLSNNSKEELQDLSHFYRANTVIDDKKQHFPLSSPYSRFLPQTYVSASFLLALTEPESIVGIPKGLREQTLLFPNKIMEKIPLDIDRFNSEKLFLAQPELAFVSFYSHPSTLNALSAQGVDLFHIDEINSLPEILNSLERVGHVINKPLQSELLKIFIVAAMTSIDNRFHALGFNETNGDTPRILLLNYHQSYSTPGKRTLVAQLLQRIGIPAYNDDESSWSISLDQEQLLHLNPDCLIFATSKPDALHAYISQTPALSQLSAVKNQRLFYVDDIVQNFPSQFIVLAYYDLLTVLSAAHLHE